MSVDAAALIAVLRARGIEVDNEASRVEGDALRAVFVHRLAIAEECRNLPKEWYAARVAAIEPEPLPNFPSQGAAAALPGPVEEEAEAVDVKAEATVQPEYDAELVEEEDEQSIEDWLKATEAAV